MMRWQGDERASRKIAYLGVLLALALICSYVETLIPFHFGIPGIKLGLTNIVVIFALYQMGAKEALGISLARICLNGLLFGNLMGVLYSISGGLFSFLIMVLLKRTGKFSPFVVSISGGILHNAGQLLIAALFVQNCNVFYYFPVLLIAGAVTGFLIGRLSQELLIRLGGDR